VLHLILRRLMLAPFLVFGVATVVFFTSRLLPGDPLEGLASPECDPQYVPRMRHQLGLDRPLPEQYARWMRACLLHGDLGTSVMAHRPVRDLLREALPNTLRLTTLALALRWTLALTFGIASALRRGRRTETSVRALTLVVDATPGFVLGVLLQLLFAYKLRWLPPEAMASIDAASLPAPARFGDALAHLVLPVVVLGVDGVAMLARYVRASVLEALGRDHVRAARARGLGERAVVWRHGVRNGIAPIVTLFGLSLPGLVAGSLLVEAIFSWPGMGSLTIHAALSRDQPVLLATTLLAASLVVIGNLAADVAAAAADPRTREPGGAHP
jgi:peptide/nickel transport system permease protein